MANGGDGGVRPCERESEGEEGRAEGEWERAGGRRGVVRGIERGGEGRQAGEQVAWRGGARARRPHSPPSVEDEDDRGGDGVGRLLAGPTSYCWAAQGGAPGKLLLLLFISVF